MVEHNSHCLLSCPKYDLASVILLMAVQQLLPDNTPVTSDTLLFDIIDGIWNVRNTIMFKVGQKYIATTKGLTHLNVN